jgi:phytoene synthase
MAEAGDYCAELVRTADRDRYVAALFAPAECRSALFALYAFNAEVARVRDLAREPLPGEIRLQWWSDVLRGERGGEAQANPVAAALLESIAHYRLPLDKLIDLLEARRFDLYDEPMATFLWNASRTCRRARRRRVRHRRTFARIAAARGAAPALSAG